MHWESLKINESQIQRASNTTQQWMPNDCMLPIPLMAIPFSNSHLFLTFPLHLNNYWRFFPYPFVPMSHFLLFFVSFPPSPPPVPCLPLSPPLLIPLSQTHTHALQDEESDRCNGQLELSDMTVFPCAKMWVAAVMQPNRKYSHSTLQKYALYKFQALNDSICDVNSCFVHMQTVSWFFISLVAFKPPKFCVTILWA